MAVLLALCRTDLALWVIAALVVASILDFRFTCWFSLVLAGMVLHDSREVLKPRHALLLALCAMDVLQRSLWKPNSDVHGCEYPLAILICAAIVFAATRLGLPWLTNRVLLFLGTISYTRYLLHATIGQTVIIRIEKLGFNANLAVAAAIAFAIALASIVTFLVEQPALRAIKERLAPERLNRLNPTFRCPSRQRRRGSFHPANLILRIW
jgi:peptidoglycan/LPS O-acetylase OafA/YrhL